MKQKKLLSVLLAGAMVVSGGSISGLEGIIPEVVAAASSTERTAGGISGEPRGGKIDLLQL